MINTPVHFSIILPVHNGGAYLTEAVQSVLEQTYPHFELLVLENASTDDTAYILTTFSDTRIKVFPSDRLLPMEENWGRAVQLDLAPYVTFLSHDDRLAPDFLSTVVSLITKYPDAGVYTTHFNLIDAKGNVLRLSKATSLIESAHEFLLATQRHQRDSYGTGYVMLRERLLVVGGIPPLPNLMFADDLLVFATMQGGYKVCDASIQFDYRYHASSAARLTTLETTFEAGKQYLDYLSRTAYMDKPEQREAAHQYVKSVLVRQHRALIVGLFTAEVATRQPYHEQIAQLRHDTRWCGEEDLAVKLFQLLLRLPHPIRKIVAVSIKIFAKLTWQLRNRR